MKLITFIVKWITTCSLPGSSRL